MWRGKCDTGQKIMYFQFFELLFFFLFTLQMQVSASADSYDSHEH